MPLTPLEQIARRCVPGEGPVQVQPLSCGLVNQTYRAARTGRLYSLRVAQREPVQRGVDASWGSELGLDRSWECRVLASAAAAGIAPVIHCCEPAQGILVADWMPGRTWSAAEAREPGNIEAMNALLRRVHSLPIPRPAREMNPAAWIAHYSAALTRVDSGAAPLSSKLRDAADHRLTRLQSTQGASVLCHSDLHRHNVAMGEHLVLIDWEYAHVSEPFWDLAGWISNNDGCARFSADLLASYLRRPALPAETERLAMMTWMYDYVCLLWSALFLRLRPPRAADEVRARSRQLERRLAAPGGRAGQDPAH